MYKFLYNDQNFSQNHFILANTLSSTWLMLYILLRTSKNLLYCWIAHSPSQLNFSICIYGNLCHLGVNNYSFDSTSCGHLMHLFLSHLPALHNSHLLDVLSDLPWSFTHTHTTDDRQRNWFHFVIALLWRQQIHIISHLILALELHIKLTLINKYNRILYKVLYMCAFWASTCTCINR